MKHSDSFIIYSATDLVGYLNCQALTAFDLSVVEGKNKAPQIWNPMLDVLWERGAEHEKQYVEHLINSGLSVCEIAGTGIDAVSIEQTLTAMKEGVDVIVQAALSHSNWVGRADVLLRVDGQSELGDWLYEPLDTKLARETKAGTVLQLCLYADLLEQTQGVAPEHVHVVPPWAEFQPETFRYQDFAAYFRFIKRTFKNYVENVDGAPYPDPKAHCDICRWRNSCDQRRREDDHLSLVANLSKAQIVELQEQGVATLAGLAALPMPLQFEPTRGSKQSLEKAREQARVQLQARETGENVFERLPVEAGFGFCLLPEPDNADIFFDFEGDAFVGEHGLEYLTGYVARNEAGEWQHHAVWALNRPEERAAFEGFVDYVMACWEQNPGLHIYHYAPYEPAALKRLMGRYGSREDEIDRMLRAGLFVDLYSVVRNSIRAGIESYSIKKLEPLFGYVREKPMDQANVALARLQADLELGKPEDIAEEIKADVQAYNKDDCIATLHLRDWLETLRQDAINDGEVIERPQRGEADASENLTEWIERVAALMERLTSDLSDDPDGWTQEQSARWLLANILDFHRREDKAAWWEYFRLAELSVEELMDERAGISGLNFSGENGGTARAPIHRYTFPPQESDIREDDSLHRDGGDKLGTVIDISIEQGFIDIKKRMDSRDLHPDALYKHKVINAQVIKDALMRLGEFVADNGIEGESEYQAARDLLLRLNPRAVTQPLIQGGEETLDAAKRIVCTMPSGILPIQGPPGSGKTYAGSRMVCELVRQGKTVGVTANSHKVIRNMLDGICEAAEEEGVDVSCLQKVPELEDNQARLSFTKQNDDLLNGIGNSIHVGGATAWFWSSADAQNLVDVLIVDEAAQMSLANVLAISGAASVVVLLGDPQQLDQPVQGSHPDGTDISALAHLLGDEETIADHQGLFLEETWRLHPDICAFTSDLFYAGKLEAREHNARQSIMSESAVTGAGLWYLPVAHEGNVNSSIEEAEAIERLVADILAGSPEWISRLNQNSPLTVDDILVITPYNAQVYEIQQRLPDIRVGTVDKFQGQEAPIAIYSTATSTQADAPRGMEFLYNLNRFNVATSRAKCACILVTSPDLMEADCRTPRQMQLANAFCRYAELAARI